MITTEFDHFLGSRVSGEGMLKISDFIGSDQFTPDRARELAEKELIIVDVADQQPGDRNFDGAERIVGEQKHNDRYNGVVNVRMNLAENGDSQPEYWYYLMLFEDGKVDFAIPYLFYDPQYYRQLTPAEMNRLVNSAGIPR